MKNKSVVIIGGGIIGVSVARELAAAGAKVTLIEKGQIGHGCSYGNAGWMTPCFAMPLPMPGMLLKSMKWLLNPEGPLYIKPEPSVLLAKWLTRFMLSMNEKQAHAAIQSLVHLSQVSLDAYKALAVRNPSSFDFTQKGLLMVGQSMDGVQAAVDEMNVVAPLGVPGKKLTPDEVYALEPAVTGKVQGGVYFPAEAHGEPLKIVLTLAEEAKAFGATIKEYCEYQSFTYSSDGKISSVLTSQGPIDADSVVMATGSWSEELGRNLGLSIPILGGKGYAMIVPPLNNQPKIPLMLVEKKIAVTPRQGSLRIAGTLELVNQDFTITQRRVDAIVKGTRQYLSLPEKLEVTELWNGLRPCTPDGVPLIGWTKKHSNLMLACGHQMLGLQAGLGTGIMVREMMMGQAPTVATKVFNPNRF